MSNRAEQAPPLPVVAAIVAGDPKAIPETLTAIEHQVYGPRRIVVVGGDAALRSLADESGVDWSASLGALLDAAGPEVTHVWLLRPGAEPRPDALRALVADSERAGSALAGSKVLDGGAPERLVSIGLATDVFGVPYRGLDEGELDAGQYDVVRDVAAVDGVSLLVRLDLVRGLGGFDPLLVDTAAAIDLSQRARLRAARVVVVPSSEVEYPAVPDAAPAWRDEAGHIRSMIKAYSLLTLVWALPLAFVIGLVEAIVAPLVGRWTLFIWVRTWLWNLLHLFSTLQGRRAARRGDVVGDAELYRYQVRGSVKLRELIEVAGERVTRRLGPEERSNLADVTRELRRPAFLSALVAVFFVVVATRAVWSDGFPAFGYSLPLPSSGVDALRAYAGGWNPGRLRQHRAASATDRPRRGPSGPSLRQRGAGVGGPDRRRLSVRYLGNDPALAYLGRGPGCGNSGRGIPHGGPGNARPRRRHRGRDPAGPGCAPVGAAHPAAAVAGLLAGTCGPRRRHGLGRRHPRPFVTPAVAGAGWSLRPVGVAECLGSGGVESGGRRRVRVSAVVAGIVAVARCGRLRCVSRAGDCLLGSRDRPGGVARDRFLSPRSLRFRPAWHWSPPGGARSQR